MALTVEQDAGLPIDKPDVVPTDREAYAESVVFLREPDEDEASLEPESARDGLSTRRDSILRRENESSDDSSKAMAKSRRVASSLCFLCLGRP